MTLADDLHIISGDASQLGQVIMNTILNAKDAMPEGGQIDINTENIIIKDPFDCGDARIKAGEYVRLRISDTGCGMDKEILKRIYEPFVYYQRRQQRNRHRLSPSFMAVIK